MSPINDIHHKCMTNEPFLPRLDTTKLPSFRISKQQLLDMLKCYKASITDVICSSFLGDAQRSRSHDKNGTRATNLVFSMYLANTRRLLSIHSASEVTLRADSESVADGAEDPPARRKRQRMDDDQKEDDDAVKKAYLTPERFVPRRSP